VYEVVKAIEKIGQKNGATFRYNAGVKEIIIENSQARGVVLESGERIEADIVISNADYAHTELALLPQELREHSPSYYESRTWAPSALLMYMGVNKKLSSLQHHSLIFSEDWKENFAQIFDHPQWPSDPSLYICVPSKTDDSVAPVDKENLLVLVPIASGLEYTQNELEAYSDKIIQTIEEVSGETFSKDILFKELFCVKDFASTYNSYKGTALGLAHTLPQTALFRPNNIHKKVKGLYFVGAGTNPGIGMPMCLISAELVYKRVKGIKTSSALTVGELEV
jgi:phytoene desaturase